MRMLYLAVSDHAPGTITIAGLVSAMFELVVKDVVTWNLCLL